MKRLLIVVCALVALVAVVPAMAQDRERPPVRLWDEFPLEPSATPTPAASPEESRPTVIRTVKDDGPSPAALIPLLAAAAGLGALAAFTAGRRRAGRPAAAPEDETAQLERALLAPSAPRPAKRIEPAPREPAAASRAAPPPEARPAPAPEPPADAPAPKPRTRRREPAADAPAPKPRSREPAADAPAPKPRSREPAADAPAPKPRSREPAADAPAPKARTRRRTAKPAPDPAAPEPAADATPAAGAPPRPRKSKSAADAPAPKPRTRRRTPKPAPAAQEREVDAAPAAELPLPAPPEPVAETAPAAAPPLPAPPEPVAETAPAAELPLPAPPEPVAETRPARTPRPEPPRAEPPAAVPVGHYAEWDTCRIKVHSRSIKSYFFVVPYEGGPVLARSPYFRAGKDGQGIGPAEALRSLVAELSAAGWYQTGSGRAPWDLRFRRDVEAPRPLTPRGR